MQALVYRPDTDMPVPLVIDIHGGAWSSGHRKSGRHYDRALAAAGICVAAIDFRQGPEFKHPASVDDINAAIDWCQSAAGPGVYTTSLGLVGSSSGGHLALATALDNAAVDFVVALWPVSDPLARYQYATARLNEEAGEFVNFAPDRLKAGHEAYFTNTGQMQEAAIQRRLTQGDYKHLPPLFIVQPELDQNVPVMMSQTLAGGWALADGDVTYKLYPGVAHGFAHAEGPQTDKCIKDMLEFIKRF